MTHLRLAGLCTVLVVVGCHAVGLTATTPVAAEASVQEDRQASTGWIPAAPVPLEVATKGGVPVDSREDYVEGTMHLDGTSRAIEIRGRGNSTWWWPKKPYKIKLGDPAALVGS